MTFYMINEGVCTRVKLYGEDVRKTLLINNWNEETINKAEYIFINTCSFLKIKEDYFLNLIKKINNELLTHQKIVIIGCLPAVNQKAILNINKNIILFGRQTNEIRNYFKLTKKIKYLSTILDEKLDNKKKIIYFIDKYFLHSNHIAFRLKRNKICHIQISTGCLGKCTYCSEKFITKLKSRKIEDILDAVKDGLKRGYQLFSLNADDVSAYGEDNNESIDSLLENILKLKGDFYICIPEFNPRGLSHKVIELLSNKKVLYITIPIQSGSNKILKAMKRPYNIKSVINNIKTLKVKNMKLKINTHIIVGFPGETEEDFKETLKVIKKGYFDRLKIFEYSDRPGTEASILKNKISKEVQIKRKKILRRQIIINSIKKLSLVDLILNLEII